jgi:hypothetical protein
MHDLITNARAKFNLPSATAADDATINTLISAASRAVQRWCRRDFISTSFDELYNGSGESRLILRQYPIISVQSVRYRPATLLKVINTNTTLNQQARVSVTSTGLTLVRVASGVSYTSTVAFAGNPTLSALAAAINALGNGWSAQVVGDYGSWPSADIRGPQGALTAWGRFAELKLHTAELAGYQIDERRGWLLRAIPYSDPELLHPEDLIWPVGVGNFRVQYTAGYATIPEDVQEATAELVASWFAQRGRDLSLHAEDTAGTYRYEVESNDQLPKRIRALLKPYRNHRVTS